MVVYRRFTFDDWDMHAMYRAVSAMIFNSREFCKCHSLPNEFHCEVNLRENHGQTDNLLLLLIETIVNSQLIVTWWSVADILIVT